MDNVKRETIVALNQVKSILRACVYGCKCDESEECITSLCMSKEALGDISNRLQKEEWDSKLVSLDKPTPLMNTTILVKLTEIESVKDLISKAYYLINQIEKSDYAEEMNHRLKNNQSYVDFVKVVNDIERNMLK